jgi:hypothetical protein
MIIGDFGLHQPVNLLTMEEITGTYDLSFLLIKQHYPTVSPIYTG